MAEEVQDYIQSARSKFYQKFYDADLSQDEKKKLIEALDYISGYDIPTLIISIMDAHISGYLKLTSDDGQTSGVSLSDGHIQQIDIVEEKSLIGNLLVSQKIITQAELEKHLAEKGPLPIGAYLVKIGAITTKTVGEILMLQSRMRLSRYINDTKYKVDFEIYREPKNATKVDQGEFYHLVHDWIASKFTAEWLKGHYYEYLAFQCEIDIGSFKEKNIETFPLLIAMGENFLETLSKKTLLDASNLYAKNENFFKAFHFLILANCIQLKQVNDVSAIDGQIRNIHNLLKNKKHTELLRELSTMTKQDPQNIEAIFNEFQRIFLSRKNTDMEIKLDIEKKVMELVLNHKKIYDDLKNEEKSLNTNKAKVDINFVNMKKLLLKDSYLEVMGQLKRYQDRKRDIPKLQLYLVWAKVAYVYFNNLKPSMADIDNEFLQILPEDVNTADHYYVNALIQKIKKKDKAADELLKKAMQIDPNIKNYPFKNGFMDSIMKIFKK